MGQDLFPEALAQALALPFRDSSLSAPAYPWRIA
jgi:hypothetical protein